MFSRQGWYSTLKDIAGLLGSRNLRVSLSSLHSEVETLLWEIECMKNLRQFQVTFAIDCPQLVKMVSEQKNVCFCNLFSRDKNLKENFHSSEIVHVPRTQNLKADSLAHCARKQTSFVAHGCRAISLVYRVYMSLYKSMTKKDIA